MICHNSFRIILRRYLLAVESNRHCRRGSTHCKIIPYILQQVSIKIGKILAECRVACDLLHTLEDSIFDLMIEDPRWGSKATLFEIIQAITINEPRRNNEKALGYALHFLQRHRSGICTTYEHRDVFCDWSLNPSYKNKCGNDALTCGKSDTQL